MLSDLNALTLAPRPVSKDVMVNASVNTAPAPGTRKGGNIPGSDQCAFTLNVPDSLDMPVVIAAPHGGRAYPDRVIADMREPRWSMLRLEDRYVDQLAVEIAKVTGAVLLTAEAPRALLDLNRAPDDIDWSMIEKGSRGKPVAARQNQRARGGLGLIPRRLPELGEIWRSRLSVDQLHARIDGIHRPYHALLGKTLDQLRDRWGAALLIDLHSMPPLKPTSVQPKPAEFVVGDRFGASCHGFLSDTALRYLANSGRRVAHNRPYSGGYVLDQQSAPGRNIHALQLEVCRSTYLDARLESPGPRLPAVARLVAGLVRELACEVAAMGRGQHMREAAE